MTDRQENDRSFDRVGNDSNRERPHQPSRGGGGKAGAEEEEATKARSEGKGGDKGGSRRKEEEQPERSMMIGAAASNRGDKEFGGRSGGGGAPWGRQLDDNRREGKMGLLGDRRGKVWVKIFLYFNVVL